MVLPVVLAGTEIQYSEDNVTWYNVSDHNNETKKAYQWSLQESTLYYFRGKNDTTEWYYTYQQTKPSGEKEMGSLSVTLFVMAITAVFGFLPFYVRFSKNALADYIMKRCCWIFAVSLLSLNTAIIVTMADKAGLGVTQELFTYLWIINWSLYLLIFYLSVSMFFNGIKLWKIRKQQKRMGEPYGDE